GSWRPPARRDRSSASSMRPCAPRSRPPTRASAWRPTAPSRCPARRRNTLPTSIARRPNGRRSCGNRARKRNERTGRMNFEFSAEQSLFADQVRRFALAHLAKDALQRAHDPRFPFEVAQLMSAQKLMGITISEADGGQGGTLMDAIIAIEQIAAVCPRSADVV